MNPEDYLYKFIMVETLNDMLFCCGVPYKIENGQVFFKVSFNIHINSETIFYDKGDDSFIYASDFEQYNIIIPNKDQQKGVIKKLYTYNIEFS